MSPIHRPRRSEQHLSASQIQKLRNSEKRVDRNEVLAAQEVSDDCRRQDQGTGSRCGGNKNGPRVRGGRARRLQGQGKNQGSWNRKLRQL
ncbi:hypothetical protein SARC_06540 [Sphaeroforma arctica JP610]|uniref:Uncharacterized protein n=1 Tax=Sphaeroforma arctica JP610 TaxID=667725 RepID=A0A0L0FWB5_9EUKA|nr:hypothetical protein SARC_06540 [Sphaeroforma arctica JP610]KNC81115.1 hypothetical protein SARC_06540 [Sphaeroforma arctica JP610]|eukprot:XP_014155017.1 hypothetical protein SARC_06540 [Sphaeroforma arctica JP610]